MAKAYFKGDRYVFMSGEEELFSVDNQHMVLFDYVEKDISRVPTLLKQLIGKKMDTETFEINNYKYNTIDSSEISEMLRDLHPYYKHKTKKAIAIAISEYYNSLLLQSAKSDQADRPTIKLDKKTHKAKLKNLISPYLKKSGEFCTRFYHRYKKQFKNGVNSSIEILTIQATQNFIKQMLFWILDASAPIIAELTINQRIWLFSRLFKVKIEYFSKILPSFPRQLPEVSFQRRGTSPDNNKADGIIKEMESSLFNLSSRLESFHNCQSDISEYTESELRQTVAYLRKQSVGETREVYEIASEYQLLFLEVLKMIESDTRIRRCKNCGNYFVMSNANMAFCSRVAEGEEKPCDVIGTKRVYERKVRSDRALESYSRAYRTRFARKQKGKISETDFRIWYEEARIKLDKVRSGELSNENFEAWLTHGIRSWNPKTTKEPYQ